MRIKGVTYGKRKTPLKVNGNPKDTFRPEGQASACPGVLRMIQKA